MAAPDVEYPASEKAVAEAETFRLMFLANPDQLDRLKATCLDEGFTVVGPASIAEAIAFLDGKDHVDVIVCSAHLDDESVFSFLQIVRAHPRHRATRFLILSLEPTAVAARLEHSTVLAGIALGADAYAVMPTFDERALIAQIREVQPRVPCLQTASPEEKKRSE